MSPLKLPLVLKKERDRRDKLKQQIRQKQKELIGLKKALGAAAQNNPQRSSKVDATADAADRPLTLNLSRVDFTDLLLPQLRAYSFVFYNRMRLLHEQQRKYLEIEDLLIAIREALRDERLSDDDDDDEQQQQMPLLRVEAFTDEELEPLAALKDKIKDDHEAMREVQRRGRGQEGVLEEVLGGLRELLKVVEGGEVDYEDVEEEESEDDEEDDDNHDDPSRLSYQSSGARLVFVPPRRPAQLPSPEPSSSPTLGPDSPSTPLNSLPVVEVDDDSSDSDSDTDME